VFFLAKGPADSCGPGCSAWIAADGRFVPGTAQRFEDFVRTLSRRDLPIFFHSPGGTVGDAVKIGLALRERRMTAGVGRTVTEQCRIFAKDDPCQRMIASGGEIKARLRFAEGQCHSACVFAFAGASNRRVSVGAMLGVHSAQLNAKLTQQRAAQDSRNVGEISISVLHHGLEQYLAQMGIDPRLQQTSSKVGPRHLYVLSRDEIQRFGVETGEFYETPWANLTDRSGHPFVIKSVTRAMETDREERRTVTIQFRCALGRTWLLYQRELPPGEVGYAELVRVAAGEAELVLHRGLKKEASEIWVIPVATPFLQSAKAVPDLVFTEDVTSSGKSREIKFSTKGLSSFIDGVAKGCDTVKAPEAAAGAAPKSTE
jgi:hypothetical protein